MHLVPSTNWQQNPGVNPQSKQSLVQTSGVTVLPVPVWLAVWALLFEFPLLFDPADEGILVVTKETNWFYLHFSTKIRQFSLELTWLGKLEIIDNIVTCHYF